jgi:1-acyl-sn-glycerol-3-phosphate acyltransferase
MIIKPKPLPIFFTRCAALFIGWLLRRRFNKLLIRDVDIKPGYSYLLMANHFSFWDGFFGIYLSFKLIDKKQKIKGLYTMSLKKQMEKKPWLKYFGSFSVEPGRRSIDDSLDYAASLLNTPGNVLIYYPQGNLETSHIRHIEFKDGVYEIVTRTKGNCQLLWSSNITDYFESLKPSISFNLLDCGTNDDFDFEVLKQKVNDFHLQAIKKNVRFTVEPGD